MHLTHGRPRKNRTTVVPAGRSTLPGRGLEVGKHAPGITTENALTSCGARRDALAQIADRAEIISRLRRTCVVVGAGRARSIHRERGWSSAGTIQRKSTINSVGSEVHGTRNTQSQRTTGLIRSQVSIFAGRQQQQQQQQQQQHHCCADVVGVVYGTVHQTRCTRTRQTAVETPLFAHKGAGEVPVEHMCHVTSTHNPSISPSSAAGLASAVLCCSCATCSSWTLSSRDRFCSSNFLILVRALRA